MKIQVSIISAVLKRHPVRQAYLFGSAARGKAGPLSDIDIAVLFQPNVNADQAERKLFADLSKTLRTDNIDLVNLADAPPLLAHRAVLLGKPLLKHDPHDAAVLKTRILHAYEDERFFRAIKERAFV